MAEDTEEEAEDKDTNLELMKEYNRYNGTKQFYQRLVQFCFFLFTIDPFAIYKGSTYRHHTVARFEIYQASSLRIELNDTDRKFKRWRTVVRRTSIYICLKFLAIMLVQMALRTSPLSPTSQEAEDSSRLLIVILGQILGNPFIALPGITMFSYGILAAGLAYTELYLFQYYTIEPFNSVEFRLWLEPEREFERIDMRILQQLDIFDQALERTCLCAIGSKRRRYSTIGPDCALEASREIQVEIIGWFRRYYWYLRPIIYTFDWYKVFNQFVVCITLPIIPVIVAFTIGSLGPLSRLIGDTSDQWARLSLYQIITTLETLLTIAFVLPMCLIQLVLFFSLCFSQLILLKDVKHHLKTCLAELRLMNSGQVVDPFVAICNILRPLIKVSHSLDELRNNIQFLTQMVAINVVVSSTSCIFILLAEQLDGEHLADFRFVIIGFHLAWTNGIFMSCAYIYTRALELETITWSLMAELRTRETHDDWILFEFRVAELWRRLIMNRCFSDSRMSVRPFGITLTYDQVLKLNFLAISYASLLKSF